MTTKQNSKQRASVAKRTLYYYWQCSKKYKWYAIGAIITTPIVVLIRTSLIQLIFANMIDTISAGLPNDQFVPVLLPQGLALIGLYLGGSAILGWLRVYWAWKFELKVLYDLGTLCFNAISSQSMRFHSDRFSGSLVSQTNKFIGSFERFFDLLVFEILYFRLEVGDIAFAVGDHFVELLPLFRARRAQAFIGVDIHQIPIASLRSPETECLHLVFQTIQLILMIRAHTAVGCDPLSVCSFRLLNSRYCFRQNVLLPSEIQHPLCSIAYRKTGVSA